MHRRLLLLAPLVLGSCGDGSSGEPGNIDIAYQFAGLEFPQRTSVYLLEADDLWSCASFSEASLERAVASTRNEIPWGTAVFSDLEAGSEWGLYAIGYSGSTPVAWGCKTGIQIEGDTTSYVDLLLMNSALSFAGSYKGEMSLSFNTGAASLLIGSDDLNAALVQVGCATFGCAPDAPTLQALDFVSEYLDHLEHLELQVELVLYQNADVMNGAVRVTHIQDVPVPTELALIEGDLSATVPGTTGAVLEPHSIRIDGAALATFLLEEVMQTSPPVGSIEVDEIFQSTMPDLVFSLGGGIGRDFDYDRTVDVIEGSFPYTTDPLESGIYYLSTADFVVWRKGE